MKPAARLVLPVAAAALAARPSLLATVVPPAAAHGLAPPPPTRWRPGLGNSFLRTMAATPLGERGVDTARLLLVDAVTGAPLPEDPGPRAARTIHDVPEAVLAGASECVMIVVKDSRERRALLELPNALGWRYHLGVQAQGQTSAGLAASTVAELCQAGVHTASPWASVRVCVSVALARPACLGW